MATKRRYRPGGTSIGFKSGVGTESTSQITADVTRRVEAEKVAKYQRKEVDELYISGLSRKQTFEEGVLDVHHKLAQKQRQHLRETSQKKADTHVKRLQGEADELTKEADYLADLAPKRAKMAENLAKGANVGIQFLNYQRLSKEWEKQMKGSGAIDEQEKQTYKLYGKAMADSDALPPRDQRALDKITRGLSGNIFWQNRMINYFNKNRKTFAADVRKDIKEKIRTSDGQLLNITEKTAYDLYETAGYLKLKELNISATSKVGVAILDNYRGWGKIEETSIINQNDARETTASLLGLVEDLEYAIGAGNKDEINLVLNAAIKIASKGTYKRENGYEVTLADGYGGGLTEFLTVFMQKSSVWKNQGDVWDFFKNNDLKVIGDRPHLKGKENWNKKHTNRIDELIKNVLDPGLKSNKKKAQERRESEGNALYLNIGNEVDQLKLPPEERDEAYKDKGSLAENRLRLLNQITKSDALPKQKKDAAELVGFVGGKLNLSVAAYRAAETGDEASLLSALSDMEKSQRVALETSGNIKLLLDLRNGQRPVGDFTGIAAFAKEGDQEIKTLSKAFNRYGNGSPHHSGKETSKIWQALVLEEFGKSADTDAPASVRLTDAKATVKKNFIDTAAEVRWDVNQGWVRRDGKDWGHEGSKKTNPFNFRTQDGGVPGLFSPGVVFVNQWDSDSNKADSLDKYVGDTDLKNVDVSDRNPNLKGIQLVELTDEAITYGDKKEVLSHPRIVSPDIGEAFLQELAKDSEEPGYLDNIVEIMPERLKKYATVHKIPYTKVINDWLKYNSSQGGAINLRVSLDGTDAVMYKTAKAKDIKPPKPYDLFGTDVYETLRANTPSIPLDNEVRFSYEQGLNSDEAFLQNYDIEYSPTGTVLDPTKYFENDGAISHLNSDLVKQFFPSMQQWDSKIGWYVSRSDRRTQLRNYVLQRPKTEQPK